MGIGKSWNCATKQLRVNFWSQGDKKCCFGTIMGEEEGSPSSIGHNAKA